MVFSSPVFLGLFLPALMGVYFFANARMRVYVGDKLVGEQSVFRGVRGRIKFKVAKEFMNVKQLKVRMEYPDAISPKEIGLNSDSRILAFLFYSVSLKEGKGDE